MPITVGERNTHSREPKCCFGFDATPRYARIESYRSLLFGGACALRERRLWELRASVTSENSSQQARVNVVPLSWTQGQHVSVLRQQDRRIKNTGHEIG